jgi:phytoene dehydrogenase-like protein
MARVETAVIGAGLAGLACAKELARQGREVVIFEAADGVGGRVRTDVQDGFCLDRGFQVLLTAYPEAQRVLDYPALGLKRFYPGALIRKQGGFEKIADPFRKPIDGVKTAFADVGSLTDKLRVAMMRGRAQRDALADIYARPDVTSTLTWLREFGFSEDMIDTFFRPFYGGVMLDDALETSSKMMEFTYKMFSAGDICIPAMGIGAITEQLARALPADRIRLKTAVHALEPGVITLTDGERVEADNIVVATELHHARALLHGRFTDDAARTWRGVTCLYFAADEAPITEPILVLNGTRAGVVNNLCVPTLLSPALAPDGQHLISVSALGAHHDETLEGAVRDQLAGWFGAQVKRWRHLRTYELLHAQPSMLPGELAVVDRPVRIERGLYICGDHRETASIEGSLRSGRRAAEALALDAR